MSLSIIGDEDVSTNEQIELEDDSFLDIDTTVNTVVSEKNTYSNYYSNQKKSHNFITKFEKAKIIGIRSQMIANGSRPCVDVPKNITSSLDIATLEFEQKKIPLLIRRKLTDNSVEDWRLEDFIN